MRGEARSRGPEDEVESGNWKGKSEFEFTKKQTIKNVLCEIQNSSLFLEHHRTENTHDTTKHVYFALYYQSVKCENFSENN